MKCPKCGTSNGKTNKYCRGCGLKLDSLAAQVAQQLSETTCAPDDVQLGEELFDVWQIYEAGNLEGALSEVERIVKCTPESAAAHSILALIYERKAEAEVEAGNVEAGRDLLMLAMARYETIIDLNPNSGADREKLASLRRKLSGNKATSVIPRRTDFATAIKRAPKPLLIGLGVFLVVLIVSIVLMPDGNDKKQPRVAVEAKQDSPATERITPVATPSPLRVYTFPAPQAGAATSRITPPPAVPNPDRIAIPTEPMKLPSLAAQVKVVPESKGDAKAAKAAAPVKAKESASDKVVVAPEKTPQPSQNETPDGSTTLAGAIGLHNQGKDGQAIVAARRAIDEFQTEINAGRNVVAAKRGAENARKLIQLCQQSTGSGQ